MKYSHLIGALFGVIFLHSCAPIIIPYIPVRVSPNISAGITVKHFPNNKVENYVSLQFKNTSNDTIEMATPEWISVRSGNNFIDSVQLKGLIERNNKQYLLPAEDIRVAVSYWSTTFSGSLDAFKKSIAGEEISVVVNYKDAEKKWRADSVLLKPDLTKK